MQLNEFKKDVIREIKQYFSKKAADFVVKRIAGEPRLEIEIEFSIYGYFVIGILIEKSTIFFTIREGGIGLKLLKSPLLSEPGEKAREIIGLSALEQLDREIRLRIPDKYLQEKYSI